MFELLFHPEAFGELEMLTPAMKAKALNALDKLETLGNELRFPHTRPIRDGLFELRAGSKDISPYLLCFCRREENLYFANLCKKITKNPD